MKKMFIGFLAVLLAAATAFAGYQPATSATDDELHWFDGNSYQGPGTIAEKQQVCDADTDIICLEGFMTVAPGNQRPPNTEPAYTLFREE